MNVPHATALKIHHGLSIASMYPQARQDFNAFSVIAKCFIAAIFYGTLAR
jgi:hypothetical protein